MTINDRIDLAIRDAVYTVRYIVPKKTGNLRYNSLKIERIDSTTWRVYIDLEIAPYAVYVNGKWVSMRWNGKTNPNEGFWQKFFEALADQIALAIGGQIVTEAGNNDNQANT